MALDHSLHRWLATAISLINLFASLPHNLLIIISPKLGPLLLMRIHQILVNILPDSHVDNESIFHHSHVALNPPPPFIPPSTHTTRPPLPPFSNLAAHLHSSPTIASMLPRSALTSIVDFFPSAPFRASILLPGHPPVYLRILRSFPLATSWPLVVWAYSVPSHDCG